MKGLGVVWAVRRCEVDSVTDGVVYAAWVALGFAVIEDISYFAIASEEGSLALVFVLRALLMPFAHPLFTVWIGLAIGRTVQAGRPLWPAALWGYALAVATHMGWNGALAIGDITGEYDERVAATVVLGAVALFLVLFVVVAVALVKMRGREQRRFIAAVPGLVLRYNVAPDEAAVFSSWRRLLRERRMLPRDVRPQFDAVHANLARLALLHDRPGGVDPHAEQVLAKHLGDARAALRTRRSVSR